MNYKNKQVLYKNTTSALTDEGFTSRST